MSAPRRTKIVATIGPASDPPDVLEALVQAGMDVARLNFSHGSHQEHTDRLARIRAASDRVGRTVAVLQDLSGPKLRVGVFAEGAVQLTPGEDFTLTTRTVAGDAREVHIDHPELVRVMQSGDRVLLADGTLELEVAEATDTDLHCRVVIGGRLGSRKGINLPTRSVGMPSLTAKDREDLRLGLDLGVDLVALSFVRRVSDLEAARRVMEEHGRRVPLLAKIEKHEAMADLDAIAAAADGLLVARGDLGVETPIEQVPFEQKDIVWAANRAGRPVIVATQMLRSMVENPRPTRAEVTDAANAILDGTDALMLSEESAVGAWPVEAVATLDRIAREAEKRAPYGSWHFRLEPEGVLGVAEGVGRAAVELAEDAGAACIVTYTRTGTTARMVAKYRPRVPVVAVSPEPETCRQLALVWGVIPWSREEDVPESELVTCALETARTLGLAGPGEPVIITAGLPAGAGKTNLLRVERMP